MYDIQYILYDMMISSHFNFEKKKKHVTFVTLQKPAFLLSHILVFIVFFYFYHTYIFI